MDPFSKIRNEKQRTARRYAVLSYSCEFVIFKFQPIAYIDAKGQQGDGDLGYNAGIIIPDEGIVSANIDHGTEHISSSKISRNAA